MKLSHFPILVLMLFGWSLHAYADNLCKDDEAAVFNCELPQKKSSLCQARSDGALVYRSGRRGRIDIEISNRKKIDAFRFSYTPYAGGGEAHIKFLNGDYKYYLYDKTIKIDDDHNLSAGIVIYLGDKRVANLICLNDASIKQQAYEGMTREEYRDVGAK
ncbi:hypothetical protein CupriaWKF_25805 [Cupriavidus sp. WKF15]|uniref:hypothetical protein n=1 Tax=Cupriavidus sp. WKF15 TaxID=3032282 RepID=UPI0023E2D20C|nr:hypothetical protein [Cupriavidus sp. WKF15]WER48216.1 hypothetical protein CupriaWKF_25805 [Cupriavidus sp. WKF15]